MIDKIQSTIFSWAQKYNSLTGIKKYLLWVGISLTVLAVIGLITFIVFNIKKWKRKLQLAKDKAEYSLQKIKHQKEIEKIDSKKCKLELEQKKIEAELEKIDLKISDVKKDEEKWKEVISRLSNWKEINEYAGIENKPK